MEWIGYFTRIRRVGGSLNAFFTAVIISATTLPTPSLQSSSFDHLISASGGQGAFRFLILHRRHIGWPHRARISILRALGLDVSIYIGTAGWNDPRHQAGTHLQKKAGCWQGLSAFQLVWRGRKIVCAAGLLAQDRWN